MKRIQLEPWTPYDKLSLASAVLRTGDQNWNAVARATRNIFEENTKYLIEEKRSPDWFSNKQCAAQYEALLKNIGPRRKKKTDKTGTEHTGDSPNDIIISAVRQECIEELKRSMATTQALYLKLHKEYEDIQAGKMDLKLEEMLEEYDAKEREKEIKLKLKFKLGEKNSELMGNNVTVKIEESEIKKPAEKEQPVSEPAKTNLTTSPLLTSLLQSPSPLTRPSLPPNTSPTISLLLNSSPSVPSTDSPTLSKLLEANNSVIGTPIVSINSTTATPQVPLKSDAMSSIPSAPTVSLSSQQPTQPSQAPSLISTSPTVVPAPSSPSVSTAPQSVPPQSTLPVQPDPISTTASVTTSSTLTTSSVTSTTTTTAVTALSSTSPVMTTTTATVSGDTDATGVSTTVDKTQVPSPSIVEELEQEPVETVPVKSTDSSEILKITEETKENIESSEAANRSTPEIVLEDLVHSVVESEVVIDQETPNKKRNIVARKLEVELVEAEPEEEVMETVEEMIEKVEEAIIETVGEGSAEIDLVLNQSSETDNLSDNIETLELDSHAVKLIVLGHDQASRINIRHDTEIASDPDKATRSVDDTVAQDETDNLGVVENLVEEEVSTSEEKVSEAEEVVEEVQEIKSPDEIVELEEIIENKEPTEVVESEENTAEHEVEKIVEEKNEEVPVKEVADEVVEEQVIDGSENDKEEKVSLKEAEEEEVEIKSVESSVKSPLEANSTENTTDVDGNVEEKKDDVIAVENIVTVKVEEADEEEESENICLEEEMKEEDVEEEEAIVEEAPEEVVIAELLEEVVQAEKILKASEDESNKVHETVTVEHISIKQDITEDDDVSISLAIEDPLKISDQEDSSLKKTDDEDSQQMAKEEEVVVIDSEKDDTTPLPQNNEKENTQKEESAESKNSGRKSKILEETLATSLNVEPVKAIKIEKDDDSSGRTAESKPRQEIEKKRPGRKRYQLAGYGDSKPNSPAPSSHSMEDDKEYKAWKKSIMLVYNRLAAHKYASVFLKPITEADATGYSSVVLKPMDLTTIKRNIETGVIRSTVEFQRDMILMAQNAMIYNKVDSLVFKMAEDMLADMMSQMEVMVQALGDGVPLWGDSEEKLNTRGRASKLQVDESGNIKRRSHVNDTPYRSRLQQQIEESAKKRRLNEDVVSKRRSEDSISKRKSISEEIIKRKPSEESTSGRKKQSDDNYTKKKSDDTSSSYSSKKKVYEDSVSGSAKRKTDESSMRKTALDDTPVSSGKRKLHQQMESRKNESSVSKRKYNADDSSSSSGRKKNAPVDDTPPSKRKLQHIDETPTLKRKRSAVAVEETRSTVKRKRADAT